MLSLRKPTQLRVDTRPVRRPLPPCVTLGYDVTGRPMLTLRRLVLVAGRADPAESTWNLAATAAEMGLGITVAQCALLEPPRGWWDVRPWWRAWRALRYLFRVNARG